MHGYQVAQEHSLLWTFYRIGPNGPDPVLCLHVSAWSGGFRFKFVCLSSMIHRGWCVDVLPVNSIPLTIPVLTRPDSTNVQMPKSAVPSVDVSLRGRFVYGNRSFIAGQMGVPFIWDLFGYGYACGGGR
jgi:hypothetical protein